jgi:hypothetical protein
MRGEIFAVLWQCKIYGLPYMVYHFDYHKVRHKSLSFHMRGEIFAEDKPRKYSKTVQETT